MPNDPNTESEPHRFHSLARAYAFLAQPLIAIGVCLAILLGLADALYRRAPNPTEFAESNQNSVDYLIVDEQLRRIVNAEPASIAIFGDSSCLMGVDPDLLGRLLRYGTVSSYCMLAYVGPLGYATAIQRLLEVQRPSRIVLMLHPAQFRREPSWESWPDFVAKWTPTRAATRTFPSAGLDYIRLNLLGRALYEPLPGSYGLFYGGQAQFVDMIAEHDGSAVDPGAGMNERSPEEVAALAARTTPLHGEGISFELNEPYRVALAGLRDTLEQFGATNVLIVIAPVPDAYFPVAGDAARDAAGREIATLLGLRDTQFVSTPATLSMVYFVPPTHLHLTRWGKQRYTRALARSFAPHLSH
jgi:hypothetical protein